MPKTSATFDPSEYAPVAERITLFYRQHPNGRIITRLLQADQQTVLFRAQVFRSATEERAAATGYASERPGDGEINTNACVENTETSAVGRALANLGITAGRQRPSLEEMAKAARASTQARADATQIGQARPAAVAETPLASNADLIDLNELLSEAERRGLPESRSRDIRRAVHATRGLPLPLDRMQAFQRELRDFLARRDAGK